MKIVIKFLDGKSEEIGNVEIFKSDVDRLFLKTKSGLTRNFFYDENVDTFEITED
jgi:hypothetical protein